MRTIDAHVHITPDGKWFHTDHDASVDRLLREMDRGEIESSVLLALAGTVSNEHIAAVCRQHPDRFIGFGAVDTRHSRSEAEIHRAVRQVRDQGLRGLKVHQRLQELPLSGREVEAILTAAGEQGLPVVFCGFPLSVSASNCLQDLTPYRYDTLAKRHPNVKLVIAHLGGHRALDAFFVAKSNRNVFLDTSYVFHYLRNTSVYADFLHILKYLPRQTLFGSDYPEVSPADYAADVRRELSALPDATAQAVCADNLLSLLPRD